MLQFRVKEVCIGTGQSAEKQFIVERKYCRWFFGGIWLRTDSFAYMDNDFKSVEEAVNHINSFSNTTQIVFSIKIKKDGTVINKQHS